MRAVLQRVSSAAVRGETTVEAIGTGLVVLVGVTHGDTVDDARALAERVHHLRILRDEQSLASSGGAAGAAAFQLGRLPLRVSA